MHNQWEKETSTSNNMNVHNRWQHSMDTDTFKFIIKLQNEDFENYKKQKKAHPDPLQLRHKEQWSAFWKGAKSKKQQAVRKKRKLVKQETAKKNKQKRKKVEEWVKLYYKVGSAEFSSFEDMEKLHNLPFPPGAEKYII